MAVIEVAEVSPHDGAGFAAWHAALEAGARAGRPAALVSSLAQLRTSLGDPGPAKRRLAVAAHDDGHVVGAMLLELPLVSDTDVVEVEIDVPPAHRGRGVGAALWAWVEQRRAREGRSVVQGELGVPEGETLGSWPGGRFATARGFVSANVEDHLVLEVPVDPAALATLEEHAGPPVGAPDGYRVEAWAGPCPEDLLADWAALHTAMDADVPTGSLSREAVVHSVERVRTGEQRRERSWTSLHALARDPAGAPVGYSTLLVPRGEDGYAQQDDTLVLREHRGHRLGARLKVATLRAYAALAPLGHPDRRLLHTWTALDNAAMQALNARFGFRRVEVLHEVERRA